MLDQLLHRRNSLRSGEEHGEFCSLIPWWKCTILVYLLRRCFIHALLALGYSVILYKWTRIFMTPDSSTFAAAYTERSGDYMPLVLRFVLYKTFVQRSIYFENKWRPKKKRIPSQATEKMEKRQTRRCGRCNHVGHNRRTCPIRDAWLYASLSLLQGAFLIMGFSPRYGPRNVYTRTHPWIFILCFFVV